MEKKLPTHAAQEILIDNGFDNSIYQLFVQSIFWRCSIGKFDGFTLNQNLENKITENLREAFKLPEFLKLKPEEKVPLIHKFPLITTFRFIKQGADPTEDYIMTNNGSTPYFIMAGKWQFQLYMDEKKIRSSQEWLFGLRTSIDVVGLYPKIKNSSHVILLTEELSDRFSKNRLDYFVEKKRRGIIGAIRDCHAHVCGFKAPLGVQAYIYRQYLAHRDKGTPEFESFIAAFLDLKDM